MTSQEIKELLKHAFVQHPGTVIRSIELSPVGGGSINYTYQVKINGSKRFFLKLNSAGSFPELFLKERNGLDFLASQDCILTPAIILHEKNDSYQLLLLEWIESGIRDDGFWEKFGEQLAKLHSTHHEYCGFTEDNYMGSLPQANTLTKDWFAFFTGYRLQPQMGLARDKGLLDKSHVSLFETLSKKLSEIFNPEKPSLLHGDLWNGNFICNEQSQPVLIDPAVYFGHRSMDLAMTTLFGGFEKAFYDSYHYYYPLPANYTDQWEVANLYPLLIHLNLFGKSYLSDIVTTLKRFT